MSIQHVRRKINTKRQKVSVLFFSKKMQFNSFPSITFSMIFGSSENVIGHKIFHRLEERKKKNEKV